MMTNALLNQGKHLDCREPTPSQTQEKNKSNYLLKTILT